MARFTPSEHPLPVVDRWGPRHWLLVLLLLTASAALGWRGRMSGLYMGDDEATYLTLSQSLEQGRYRSEFLEGTPLHTKYPPGMPAFLVVVRRVAGPDLDAVRAANLLLLLITAVLIGDGCRRLSAPWIGVAAVGVIALNPRLLSSAGTVLADPLYTALISFAAWGGLRAELSGRAWGPVAAGAALLGFFTRTVGVTAVAGIWGWAVMRRRWRLAAGFGLTAAVLLGGWFLYSSRAAPVELGVNYTAEFERATRDPGGPAMVDRVMRNAVGYATRSLPGSLGLPTIPGTIVDNVAWVTALVALGTAGLFVLLRRWPAMAGVILATIGVLLIWPWYLSRLLAPVLPGIVAALILGAVALGGLVGERAGRAAALAVVGVLMGAGVSAFVSREWDRSGCDRRNPYADTTCYSPRERGLLAAAGFARDSLPPEAVLVTSKPAIVHYFSGRRTLTPYVLQRANTPDTASRLRLAGASHILLTGFQGVEVQVIRPILQRRCAEFAALAEFPNTVLLAPRNASGRDDACGALERFADQVQSTSREP